MAQSPEPRHRPIRSQYADDPDMADLVDLFVGEMPARLTSLRAAWEAGEVEGLTRLTHQLTGACAGYGFPSVGKAARELELRLRALDQGGAEQRLAELSREYETLMDLCNRTCGMQPRT
jgi:histidine phosphotransfer protein HptB